MDTHEFVAKINARQRKDEKNRQRQATGNHSKRLPKKRG